VMELVLVKDVPLLDWSGKIGSREGIKLCKNFCKKRNSVTTYPFFFGCTCIIYCLFAFLMSDKLFRWISIGSDLKYDARRDLDDVGAKCVEGANLQMHCLFWVMSKMKLQFILIEAISCKELELRDMMCMKAYRLTCNVTCIKHYGSAYKREVL
jgi:hypothetical protein